MKQLIASWRRRQEAAAALRKERQEAIEQTARDEAGQLVAEQKRSAEVHRQQVAQVKDLIAACVDLRHSETNRMYDLHLDYLPGYGFIYMRLSGEIVKPGQGHTKEILKVEALETTTLLKLEALLERARLHLQSHKADRLSSAP